MKSKNTIRVVCAVGAVISIFLITCFLGLLLVRIALGNTAYAVKIPLLLPLCAIAAILTGNIFSFENELETEFEEEDIKEEITETPAIKSYTPPQLDESIYPELFSKSFDETETVSFERPDIKQILREQRQESEEASPTDEAEAENEEDPIFSFAKSAKEEKTLYMDLPDELPEDYVAYEYEDDSEEENFEEEEYIAPRIPRVIIRITAALIAIISAIFIPINCSTVYSNDSITIRRPFSEKHYSITAADYYTVGVTLTGDLSMKLHFEDDREFEMIVPSTAIKSGNFKSNFSSSYAYAAFCNRLLTRSDIEKRFDDISSLDPSPALSQKDLAYIAEITETDLNNNNNNNN